MPSTEHEDTTIPPKPYSKGWLSAFQQQRMKSFYVLYKPLPLAIFLLGIGIISLALGIVQIIFSKKTVSLDYRYDNINNYKFQMENSTAYPHTFPFNGSTFSMGTSTYLSIELKETLAAPVLLLYKLKKYNQNYRSFLVSIDESQLNGGNAEVISDCKPFRYPGEFQDDVQDGYYSPCGTIAWSTFNDSFRLYKISSDDYGTEEVPSESTLICDGSLFDSEGNSLSDNNKCRKKNIALSSIKYGYKPPITDTKNEGPIWKAGGDSSSSDPFLEHGYYYGEPGHLIPNTTDEDFILWSTPSYLPDFSNIYRVIETDLEPGTYLFEITELYSFPGEKHIMLTTRNWLGSSHLELGGLTTGLGAIALISAFLMVVMRYPFATQ